MAQSLHIKIIHKLQPDHLISVHRNGETVQAQPGLQYVLDSDEQVPVHIRTTRHQ